MKKISLTLALWSALLLTACGYQLRGSAAGGGEWKLGNTFLVNAGASTLISIVDQQMRIFGIPLVGDRNKADTIITIGNEAYDRRTLSVDPDTGKVREYEVDIEANLTALRQDGGVLLDNAAVQITRDFIFDETSVHGSSFQESALQAEMRLDAAQNIIRRLQALDPANAVMPPPATPAASQ